MIRLKNPSHVAVIVALVAVLCVFVNPLLAVDFGKLKVGDSVQLKLHRGGTFEGEVAKIEEGFIHIKTKFGPQKIAKDKIESFEKVKTPKDMFDERRKDCTTADHWVALGETMEKLNDYDLASEAYARAVDIEPDHAKAREARGEMQYEGKWMPKEAAYGLMKWKKFHGVWMSPEDHAAAMAEEKSELKARKMKGQHDLQREYIGRPYAKVDPVLTEHYEIWCTSTEEVAKRYANFMEAMFERYNSVFKNFPRNNKGRAKLTIHANKQQFMDWNDSSPGTGGFYNIGSGNVFAYHGSFGTTGSTFEVLAHEGTHQFEGFILKSVFACPMWVIEGMAVFFGDGSEYKKGKVEIGLIPRDRLQSLQRMIENGSYPPLERLFSIGMPFSGFYYAPAWGVVYWCLWGNRAPVKAYSEKTMGMDIFGEFFLPITKKSGRCDYAAESRRFIGLLEQHTGQDKDEWEAEYKDWLLKLPLERLMRRRSGGRYESEKLGFAVRKPSGWNSERDLRRGEQIAFLGSGGKRISTAVWSNWDRAALSETLANKIISNVYTTPDFEADDDCYPPRAGVVEGLDAMEAVFIGKKPVASESDAGSASGGAAVERETVKVHAVIYASVDKVRANVYEGEADAKWSELDTKYFLRYLKDFEIAN